MFRAGYRTLDLDITYDFIDFFFFFKSSQIIFGFFFDCYRFRTRIYTFLNVFSLSRRLKGPQL